MSKRVGVTIGKFMPLHKGHESMIKFGSMMLSELVVVVSGKLTDEINLSVRADWVREFCRKEQLTNVTVVRHIDESPEFTSVDENGTVLDEDFQQYWRNEFTNIVPDATHFLSSDKYGKVMADLMEAEWLPFDPGREMLEISATKIRNDVQTYFWYISDVAKPHFVKKVAIVGPESCGKSTLVKYLADTFGCAFANEYGRTISVEKSNDLDFIDFLDILNGQEALIDIAVKNTTVPLMITDTEAYVTHLFAEIYLRPECTSPFSVFEARAKLQNFDLYIVLSPTVPWVNDGSRVMDKQQARWDFYERLISFLKENNKPFVTIDDTDFTARTLAAVKHIKNLL